MPRSTRTAILIATIFSLLPLSLFAQNQDNDNSAIIRYDAIHHPVIGKQGMVSSQRMLSSQIGAEILSKGGNAVDAAVATGISLAVTLPRAGNLGGGGFMLVHLAETGETIAIDYREMAPRAASRDMFLDDEGNVDNQKARFSYLSSGVPGTVAGLAYALEKYGTMSWEDVVKPAIRLAEEGILVSYDLADNLKKRRGRLTAYPATADIFYKEDGSNYEVGETFVQSDLANTLKRLAKYGPKEFYTGKTAELIANDMKAKGGLITLDDLANYKVAEREVVSTHYRGYHIVSMPPTSSGGVHIAQMLNMLEHYPIKENGFGSARNIHLMTEVMKLAYADRSEYLGDPDHFDVPIKGLTDKAYAKKLTNKISVDKATPSSQIKPGNPAPYESPDTTHFSVMDKFGNAVSNTYTLNFSYGSGVVIPGTGILMNNEMDDFSSKPGVPNGFGLIGGEANAIQPTKRPLSSMTPTMILKDNKPYVVLGSPGGSRIITTVLQTVVNIIDHDMGIAQAIHAPRIHHQWLPDRLEMEPGFSPDTLKILESYGQSIKMSSTMGSVQAIMYHNGYFYGVSDPRRPGAGTVPAK
ncbi:gamma-glutamyltransferase [Alteromonas sediminis]|uniref:Glutathione hydrolase proenzyme n=1 Tax=Alteromonas sediminis TaxID=2259342 RepID=A0A3N5Y1X7_9ALTE|nr:gamma-glutamyltransferase [Alteromonas sediminis]RPJ66606.1 gamma-glutamyltransferase [Alteromonas sediminis]